MRVGYVVLYVHDAEACRRFWVDQIGMVEKRRTEAGTFTIAQVGFADQPFAFELVPLELMKDNPDGLAHARSASFCSSSAPGANWPSRRCLPSAAGSLVTSTTSSVMAWPQCCSR